jgi:hypothetical protein
MIELSTRPEGIFGMSETHQTSAMVEATNPVVEERRRPGRIASVSSALISLLRGSTVPVPHSEKPHENRVPPARGIIFGVAISGLFWAVLISII